MIKHIIIAMMLATTAQADIVIRDEPGGFVVQHEVRRAAMEQSGERVRISGYCHSACTIFISLPNACVERQAVLGFHGTIPRHNDEIDQLAQDYALARYYPRAVQVRYIKNWRHQPLHKIDGARLAKLDPSIALCP